MIYTCINCDKTFKQKSGFTDHLNRKNPCIKLTKNIHQDPSVPQISSNIHQNPPNIHQTSTKIHQDPPSIHQKNDEPLCASTLVIKKRKKNYNCNFCNELFCRSDVLKKHLARCKIRKEETHDKEIIYQELLRKMESYEKEKDNQDNIIKELNDKIEKLENNNKINHTQNNKNIKNQNNGISNTINIIGFGKEDLTKIDNTSFFEALTQMGYKIPAKMLEKIHINEKYPEYKNIYISDINRGKAMIYDGKKWKLDKYDNISDTLLDKVLNFIEERYDEIKDDKSISEKKKTTMGKRLQILEIMKDYEEEKERERYEYLRNQCKDKIKIDLYNNRESIAEEDDSDFTSR